MRRRGHHHPPMTGRAARTALRHDGGVCARAVDIGCCVVRLLAYRERYLRAWFVDPPCRSQRDAMKRTPIGIMLARACTRACCNSQRAVSAPTASAVTPAREVAAEQILYASGRHQSSDLQSTHHCHRVKNQGRTTLWDRQGVCKVAQILSQELSSFSEPEIMDLWFTLLKGAVSY